MSNIKDVKNNNKNNKISKKEIEKSRKIVLESIKEETVKQVNFQKNKEKVSKKIEIADIKKFNFNFKLKTKINYCKAFKQSVQIILAFFSIIFFCYFLFVFLILEFRIDNKYTRIISQYFIVPAYIISDKVIEYYDYVDLKNENINFINSKLIDKTVWSFVE